MNQLQEFDYEVVTRSTPITSKPAFVFICKHEGICNKEFERSWNLLDHLRMHNGIKPFKCNECRKQFTQKCNMLKHISKYHG
mmetsp:Transcript_11364/g.10031  ORF Transcript_11364/g.10031 Transcript_11364/m.10031 type:complete len:82 (+) Transcript_11364:353-598(+)